ncbi:hypothetical protein D9758_003641 [Tetrapyrgos nigripes]|uniref:Uncharacterized protein n=1 Tax=Tetrapyrgos nigripes TaxID=182062 RepID=A0A8H5GMP6_9AGAR|nr:hypothetical protein D9758_003641 [Tetrapyrgos nigripes]
MSSRRTNRVSTLAIVLPRPTLPRRSSLLSLTSSSPRTPRSSGCASPTCHSWLFPASNNNRRSIDSWNSSNQDVGEDCESEWKPEQVLLLSRTLDALPSHLVTPFNGPIPPSNLLDKIARGVANAKGAAEWPHSLRATRVKLIEICRQRAREEGQTPVRRVVDENDDISCYNPDSDVNIGGPHRKNSMGRVRRPLYRQSSMDFLNTDDPKAENDRITRLSTRLQRTDNVIPNVSYHPYTTRSRSRALTLAQTQASRNPMNRRSSSPPRPAHVPSLISPSTPSSSTLNTLSSISTSAARNHLLQSTASTLSTSDCSMRSRSSMSEQDASLLPSVIPPLDPRVQRVRRSESFCAPSSPASFTSPTRDEFPFPATARTPPPQRQAFKRAPSYGTLAQEKKERRASVVSDDHMNISPCPSSDEEEKLRSKQVKKPRASKAPVIGASPSVSKKASSRSGSQKSPRKSRANPPAPINTQPLAAASELPRSRPPLRMNLQRNPSMFGEELPHLHIPSPSSSRNGVQPTPVQASSDPVQTPRTIKTLRRVKRLQAPSRKISFGSLIAPPGEDADMEEEGEPILGSAFQLA